MNCYECVRSIDVDSHSLACTRTAPEHLSEQAKCDAINLKIEKLIATLRLRLIEIEVSEDT